MDGWEGTLLRVDLSNDAFAVEPLSADNVRRFIGGRGIASRIVSNEVDPRCDPLGPGNKLVLSAGSLAGTAAVSSARYNIAARSPLTGGLTHFNAGGHFGAALRMAGFDAIVIEGAAETPVYLSITDGKVAIEPATDMWGLGVSQTKVAVAERTDERTRVIAIGPAGEGLIDIAGSSDSGHWTAGGAGLGAVMGSKKLKAIAVKGSRVTPVADRDAFRAAALRALDDLKDNLLVCRSLPEYGTGALVRLANDAGVLPTNNFQTGFFARAAEIGGEAVAGRMLVGNAACFSCPFSCGRITRSGDRSASPGVRGPEYEHLWAFGSCCGVDDLSSIAWASGHCREYGLDPVSAGLAVACAMELAENGALSRQDIGVQLAFGDAPSLIRLIHEISVKKDFGRLLGKGASEVARVFDNTSAFVGVRGEELAAFDPRGSRALALHYATANSRTDHLLGSLFLWKETAEGSVASQVKRAQDLSLALSAVGICPLVASALDPEHVAGLLSARTGLHYTPDDLLEAGERIWNLERLYNSRCEDSPQEDRLPDRMREPLPDGPARGQRTCVEDDLPQYYRERGWDSGGRPTATLLHRLGIQGAS